MSYTPTKEQLKMYEVTPLEHLEALKDIVVAKQNEEDIRLEQTIQYDIIQRELYEYNKLTTPPNEQEVCEALGEYWGERFRYNNNNMIFEKYSGDGMWKKLDLLRLRKDAPRLITLIGRFYEGRAKENE